MNLNANGRRTLGVPDGVGDERSNVSLAVIESDFPSSRQADFEGV